MCRDVARDSRLTSRNRGRLSTPLQIINRIRYNQSALQQGLADKEKRQILQKLTQIGGVQRYKDELRQALARH